MNQMCPLKPWRSLCCMWRKIKNIHLLTFPDPTTFNWLTSSVSFLNLQSPLLFVCIVHMHSIWNFGFHASAFAQLQCIYLFIFNVYASSSSSLGIRSRMLSLRRLFSELYSLCSFSSSLSSACSRCRCTARRFLTCFIRNGFKSQKAMLVNFLWREWA